MSVGDTSGASVELTLWHARAAEWSAPVGSLVAFRGVRVHEYNGCFVFFSFLFFSFLFFSFLFFSFLFL